MTTTLGDALREEHLTFQPRIDELRRLAETCVEEPLPAVAGDLDRVLDFLEQDLLPHAAAEDAVLYVAVAEVLGDLRATDTMRRDHEEVRRLVRTLRVLRDELGTSLAPAAQRQLRRVLYGLHAVLTLHVAKEEELYLPLLESSISGAASTALLHAMHGAVEDARGIHDVEALAADGG